MGLAGIECAQNMESVNQLGLLSGELGCSALNSPTLLWDSDFIFPMPSLDMDGSCTAQLQVLLQAQALLKKSCVYQKIDEALQKVAAYRPNLHNLPRTAVEEDHATVVQRNTAVSNLRFLNIFYGFNPASFALSVNLLDRLLGKVKAHPRYLSCIATTCFYIAIKQIEDDMFVPSAAELVKISQCGGQAADLLRMENLILEKLQWDLNAITPLTFLQYFLDVFASKEPKLDDPAILGVLISKLEVLMCQCDFAKYKAETLALALLSCVLQDLQLVSDFNLYTTVVELQYYCQLSDIEFLQCRGLVLDYLVLYCTQPSKLPRLQLVWTVSRRTLTKMKPSQRILFDLEPIMEDEGDEDEDSDDAGPFDSENEEQNCCSYVVHGHCPSQKSTLGGLASDTDMDVCSLQDTCSELSFMMLHSKDKM